jgi:hypothetical protein
MKPPVSVQNEEALHKEQDDPTEHDEAMSNDQGDDLPRDVARETLAMQIKLAKSEGGGKQHHRSRDDIEKPLRLQGLCSRALSPRLSCRG